MRLVHSVRKTVDRPSLDEFGQKLNNAMRATKGHTQDLHVKVWNIIISDYKKYIHDIDCHTEWINSQKEIVRASDTVEEADRLFGVLDSKNKKFIADWKPKVNEFITFSLNKLEEFIHEEQVEKEKKPAIQKNLPNDQDNSIEQKLLEAQKILEENNCAAEKLKNEYLEVKSNNSFLKENITDLRSIILSKDEKLENQAHAIELQRNEINDKDIQIKEQKLKYDELKKCYDDLTTKHHEYGEEYDSSITLSGEEFIN